MEKTKNVKVLIIALFKWNRQYTFTLSIPFEQCPDNSEEKTLKLGNNLDAIMKLKFDNYRVQLYAPIVDELDGGKRQR